MSSKILAAVYPQADPDGWQVAIGTINVPEKLCKLGLVGLETGVTLDKKKAAGRNGATITYQGEELATWSIEVESWNPEGWRVLIAICGLAKKAKGDPLAVHHPMLGAADIDKMIVEKVKWPGNDSTVLQRATLQCVQWVPQPKKPKVVTKTPKIAKVPDALSIHKAGGKNFDVPKGPAPVGSSKPIGALPAAPWTLPPKL